MNYRLQKQSGKEPTIQPLQLLLTERGGVGDGYAVADLTTSYEYSTDNKGRLVKISYPDVDLPTTPLQTQSSETIFEVNQRGQTTATPLPARGFDMN